MVVSKQKFSVDWVPYCLSGLGGRRVRVAGRQFRVWGSGFKGLCSLLRLSSIQEVVPLDISHLVSVCKERATDFGNSTPCMYIHLNITPSLSP